MAGAGPTTTATAAATTATTTATSSTTTTTAEPAAEAPRQHLQEHVDSPVNPLLLATTPPAPASGSAVTATQPVLVLNCLVHNGSASLDWAVVHRQQLASLQQTGRLPPVRLIVKENAPIQIELVFCINTGPVHLVASLVSLKQQDHQMLNSYVENLGVFGVRAEPYRCVLRGNMPPQSRLFAKQAHSLTITLSDPIDHVAYFAYEIQVIVKRAFPALLEPFNNSFNSSLSAAASSVTSATTQAVPGNTPDEMAQPASWNHVQRQAIPGEEEDSERPDDPEPTTLNQQFARKATQDFPGGSKKGTNMLRELGYWLYSSNVGQYFMRFGDERSRSADVKDTYALSTIWVLGQAYQLKPSDEESTTSERETSSIPPPATQDQPRHTSTFVRTDSSSSVDSLPVTITPLQSAQFGNISSGASNTITQPRSSVKKPRTKSHGNSTRERQTVASTSSPSSPSAARHDIILPPPYQAEQLRFDLVLPRLGLIGDLFSVRVVRKYPLRLSLEQLGIIREFLTSQNYVVQHMDEVNIRAEESDGSQPSQFCNVIYIRVYHVWSGVSDCTVLDISLFGSVRKATVMSALLVVNLNLGVSNGAILDARAHDATKFVDRLLAFVDVANTTGELVFREGHNVDVTLSQQSAVAISVGSNSPQTNTAGKSKGRRRSSVPRTSISGPMPIEGTLSMWRHEQPSGWTEINARIDDGVLSYDGDSTALPLRHSVISFNCPDNNTFRFDISLNSCVYQMRAYSAEDFSRWSKVLRASAGLLIESADQSSPSIDSLASVSASIMHRLAPQPHSADVVTDSSPQPTHVNSEVALAHKAMLLERSPSERSLSRQPSISSPQPDTLEPPDGSLPEMTLYSNTSAKGTSPEIDPNYTYNQDILISFLQDFQSRFWFTYRKDFSRMEPSYFTTDVGWGCMLRTAQMLMAQGLSAVLLSRDWRLHHPQSRENLASYKQIVSMFNDRASSQAIFSIHHLVQEGVKMGKKIGEWFGPSTAAYAFKQRVLQTPSCPVAVYLNNEQVIYKDMVTNIAEGGTGFSPILAEDARRGSVTFKPVVILMPVRLGVEKLNDIYHESLKALFRLPQCIGIAGGKPCKSLYFVACQDDELFFLDPHFLHPFTDTRTIRVFPVETYHCSTVRRVHLSKLDPSMLIGFVVTSAADFANLSLELEKLGTIATPIISVLDKTPAYVREAYLESEEERGGPVPVLPTAAQRQLQHSPSPSVEWEVIGSPSSGLSTAVAAGSSDTESSWLRPPSLRRLSITGSGNEPGSSSSSVSFDIV